MDNNKRNIHNSGPLGMLVKSGQIQKINEMDIQKDEMLSTIQNKIASTSYFKTQVGIEFSENEFLSLDPKECEPWKYANRQNDELGEMQDLIDSIERNKQLQPGLVRKHPTPHDNIKYEIIFGRRRHIACLKLNIPFLAICKNIVDARDGIALQDAENKFRNNISNYSNAMLYRRLLDDGVFKMEKELAEKLKMSISTFNDLMAYARIPQEIVLRIQNVHILSNSLVLKMLSILNKSDKNYNKILEIAPRLGQSITSAAKLEQAIQKTDMGLSFAKRSNTKTITSETGEKLFTAKVDQHGNHCIVLNKNIIQHVDVKEVHKVIQDHLECAMRAKTIRISGL